MLYTDLKSRFTYLLFVNASKDEPLNKTYQAFALDKEYNEMDYGLDEKWSYDRKHFQHLSPVRIKKIISFFL